MGRGQGVAHVNPFVKLSSVLILPWALIKGNTFGGKVILFVYVGLFFFPLIFERYRVKVWRAFSGIDQCAPAKVQMSLFGEVGERVMVAMWVFMALAAEFFPGCWKIQIKDRASGHTETSVSSKPFCGVGWTSLALIPFKRNVCSCDSSPQVRTGLDLQRRAVVIKETWYTF